jgi:hypothetical protein
VARRIKGLDNPAGRATELPKLFSARPALTLRRPRAYLFLNSQVKYCVDKGRVTHYIPRCLELTSHVKFSQKACFVLKSTREV